MKFVSLHKNAIAIIPRQEELALPMLIRDKLSYVTQDPKYGYLVVQTRSYSYRTLELCV